MKVLRYALCFVIVAVAAVALYRYTYLPYRCNQRVKFVKKAVLEAMNRGSLQFFANLARTEIPNLDRCIACEETNVEIYVVKGAVLRLVKRWDEAISAYEQALRYDRRTEIYWNLANCYLEVGRQEDAIEYFAVTQYLNPRRYTRPPSHLAREVERRVRELDPSQLPF